MKKVIVINSIKGGVGKTTLSVNLAVALSKHHKVTVFDLDTTETSALFFSKRTDVSCYCDMSLREFNDTLKVTDGISIVDSAGYMSDLAVSALFKSDLVIVPTMLETVDVVGTKATMRKYEKINSSKLKLNVKILPNKINPTTKQETAESVLECLGDFDILPLVKNYTSYSKAFTKHQSILEYKKALPSTIQNFNEFIDGVLNEIK